MSVPGNLNTAPPPSSFDNDTDFYDENRWSKLKRRLTEEPLIPLGCALTCWALVEATRSIRSGDKNRTNRMFRRRIYAQGFTIVAMFAGSVYWEGDRQKRGKYNDLLEDKKKKEKNEAWLKELEAREEEEQHLRKTRDRLITARVAEKTRMSEAEKRAVEKQTKEAVGQNKGGFGEVTSVLEASERRGPVMKALWEVWERRR
ncbi:Respiratory supercomplex factor 1, mitochondrial [Meristemomyces frigidus]|nr:Respiratory supercomplex factor 1, mitochondrial [Meristemomyces frigidus]